MSFFKKNYCFTTFFSLKDFLSNSLSINAQNMQLDESFFNKAILFTSQRLNYLTNEFLFQNWREMTMRRKILIKNLGYFYCNWLLNNQLQFLANKSHEELMTIAKTLEIKFEPLSVIEKIKTSFTNCNLPINISAFAPIILNEITSGDFMQKNTIFSDNIQNTNFNESVEMKPEDKLYIRKLGIISENNTIIHNVIEQPNPQTNPSKDSFEVKISSDAGNALTVHSNGLFASGYEPDGISITLSATNKLQAIGVLRVPNNEMINIQDTIQYVQINKNIIEMQNEINILKNRCNYLETKLTAEIESLKLEIINLKT